MNCFIHKEIPAADAYIIPVQASRNLLMDLPSRPLREAADYVVRHLPQDAGLKEISFLSEEKEILVVGVSLAKEPLRPRDVYLSMAQALRKCKRSGAKDVAILLDNCPPLAAEPVLLGTTARLAELVNYENRGQKSVCPQDTGFHNVALVTAAEGLDTVLEQALCCARGTTAARELCNQRASSQTPETLAEDAARLCRESGCEVEILTAAEAASLNMDAFLAVARGAQNTPPVVIILRWLHGGDTPTVGLIGKGIVYDSGGYSLKSNTSMRNMFDDMGGGAAVIGAMSAIAGSRLPVNAVGVIAACENKISYNAYLPGDIIGSMAGKTIEVTNTDAEGRLTLADALTLAIHREKCDLLVDIATLTGAAKNAVGRFASAVFSNDDEFFQLLKKAADIASEKVWRLDLDPEMRPCLNSPVADLRNGSINPSDGGGAMLAALFLQEFTEGKPWIHIDMAGVNFRLEPPAFSAAGATGYGAALLYCLAKELPDFWGRCTEK